MAALKTILAFTVAGTLVGAVVASLIAPGFLTWYNTPGDATAQTMCACAPLVRSTAEQLIRGQLIGAGVGAAVFFIVGVLFVRGRALRRKQAPSALSTTAASSDA